MQTGVAQAIHMLRTRTAAGMLLKRSKTQICLHSNRRTSFETASVSDGQACPVQPQAAGAGCRLRPQEAHPPALRPLAWALKQAWPWQCTQPEAATACQSLWPGGGPGAAWLLLVHRDGTARAGGAGSPGALLPVALPDCSASALAAASNPQTLRL